MVSPACENCWSATQTSVRAKQTNPKTKARYEGLTNEKKQFNGKIRVHRDALKIPATVKAPTLFAVWNDLFHPDVDGGFIFTALHMMWHNPRHTFIVLTKRPDRAAEFCWSQPVKMESYPPNMILGTTVESQKYTYRIDQLIEAPAYFKMVSYEPALEYVDFRPYMPNKGLPSWKQPELDWIIMGCESGKDRRPMDIEWARKTQKQCADAGVAFFLKQMEVDGKVVGLPKLDGKTYAEFPEIKK